MPENRTGSGEPSRTLALLWGYEPAPRKRGPARSLTVRHVVDAAIAIADGGGVDAVTIRAVAVKLNVSAMSVYTYVPGKLELIDLMVDAVYKAMSHHQWGAQPWRERAANVAEANRQLFTAHPWLLNTASQSRPPLGPGTIAKYEHELAAFDETGLADVNVDAALTYLLGFVHAHGLAARAARYSTGDSGISDVQWWDANRPLLEEVLHTERYPRAVRIGAATGKSQGSAWDAEQAWHFGLNRTLDGLAALIEDKA